MQTTAIRTVANSLPENEVILLTLLISKRYIPYTDLRKILEKIGIAGSTFRNFDAENPAGRTKAVVPVCRSGLCRDETR